MLEHIASAAAYGMVLADLANPKACLPPGFSSPVSTALGWVKALGLVVAIVALIRIGVHVLRQQGDGVPDRDDTFDKLINWVVGIFIVAGPGVHERARTVHRGKLLSGWRAGARAASSRCFSRWRPSCHSRPAEDRTSTR